MSKNHDVTADQAPAGEAQPTPLTPQQRQGITDLLENARRRLVDTGTRNRLIHVNRSSRSANCLNVINERSDDLFSLLRTNSKKMRFLGQGTDEELSEDEDSPYLEEISDDSEESLKKRHTDKNIETPLGPDALQKRLLRLARDARTAEEEQGINILYLALGFLTWYEDPNSSIAREAPLILLPVELIRDDRRGTYDLKARDDDIVTNLPLQERLAGDFGISLPEIDDGEEQTPAAYFDEVRAAIQSQQRWEVQDDAVQLGFFSFAKLLMLHDLEPDNWPDDALMQNALLTALLTDGFSADQQQGSAFGDGDTKLDELLEPGEIIQVVDADASQTKVIEDVRRGVSMVVQGPPGTGKSQTIANIIAAAVHDGKTVLFMAEKMAALTVVKSRLEKVNLEHICLELHSRKANKKALAQALGKTLNAAGSAGDTQTSPAALRQARDRLNEASEVLHQPVESLGYSPFEVLSQLVGFINSETPPSSIPQEELSGLNKAQEEEIATTIRRYASTIEKYGKRNEHPFYGTGSLQLQPTDLQRFKLALQQGLQVSEQLDEQVQEHVRSLQIPPMDTLQDVSNLAQLLGLLGQPPECAKTMLDAVWALYVDERFIDALQVACDWGTCREGLADTFVDGCWEQPVQQWRVSIARGVGSWMTRLFSFDYRGASSNLGTLLKSPLSKSPAERLQLLDQLIEAQGKQKLFEEDEHYLQQAAGNLWRGLRTPFAEMSQTVNWLRDIRGLGFSPELERARELVNSGETHTKDIERLNQAAQSVRESLSKVFEQLGFRLEILLDADAGADNIGVEQAPLPRVKSTWSGMYEDIERYAGWVALQNAADALAACGYGELLRRIDAGDLAPECAEAEFCYALAEARWEHAINTIPGLSDIARADRHALVKEFQELDAARFRDTQTLILERHLQQLPSGAAGQMGFIRGEINRRARHKPVRKVIQKAGEMVQRIKPVFLMSPISVAQFLPPGKLKFDLLVIDEASQVKPEDALGAIARARQIVVVGDQKQLPPTSFFDRLTGDSEDQDEDGDAGAQITDMESVLSLCEARGLASRMLEWHYRSRDPSLIKVSNQEFYNNNLVLPPSPFEGDDDFGLSFTKVLGVYGGGGTRKATNRIEAEAVADAIAEHARKTPDWSLGVVTFSLSQRNMVTETLEFKRRSDEVLDAFLREGQAEDVFIKNIENVQGDERDVIFISVGYGPQEPGGRLTRMNFGPVNNEGGERRLNVLFSRSRIQCRVFASFDSGDIDLTRSPTEGVRVFKLFLDFAQNGDVALATQGSTGLPADSPFEEDVAREIRRLGYEADHQVGSSGFLIDLGVRHESRPGQYMLAVECDGATYHSSLWARERDRLRQSVLEHLGWNFHRIWSTDWFYRRNQELGRLEKALTNARERMVRGMQPEGSNVGSEDGDDDDAGPGGADNNLGESDVGGASEAPETSQATVLTAPAYQKVDLDMWSSSGLSHLLGYEPHELAADQLSPVVQCIVEWEGPLHQDEVARRLASAFGKSQAGSRIVRLTLAALQAARASNQGPESSVLLCQGEFWMTAEQAANPPIRNRAQATGSVVQAENLPPVEIKAAAQIVLQECGAMDKDEWARETARMLGFNRAGSALRAVILANLE